MLSPHEYESLYESAPIGYFILDRIGTILDANRYGANLLQAERQYLMRRPFATFVPAEHHARFHEHLQRVLDEARVQSSELPIVDHRGRRLWGRFETRLQVDGSTCPRCFMAVIDVTDRKLMEDDLILAREEAVQASRAKSLFLANMSHEIRTPMNGVLAMADLLAETVLTAEQREWLQVISDSARSLTQIIDDVLDFSRMEANRLKLESAPFSLDELIEAVRSFYEPQAIERSLELRVVRSEPADRWYIGDRSRIRQVMNNLLSNALKFTEQGEVELTVSSQAITPGLDEIGFAVRDTGIGIRESQRESVFESFHQGEITYSKSYQGTGLGLSISRRLARLMGGQLYFTSREGAGSTFYFTLPLHRADPPQSTGPQEASNGSPAERPVGILGDDHG